MTVQIHFCLYVYAKSHWNILIKLTCFRSTRVLLFEISHSYELLSSLPAHTKHPGAEKQPQFSSQEKQLHILEINSKHYLKVKISMTSSGVLRATFTLWPWCTYTPPSKLVDVLSWVTHSDPTRPNAPSTPALTEMATSALRQKTNMTLYHDFNLTAHWQASPHILWFDITSRWELWPALVVCSAFKSQWEDCGHVDAQPHG